jgi:hypothetical protein
MKLITSRPQDGIESSQHPIYVSAKRFIALLEATGAATLLMLQANILVAWYEYGQAIYPAAYMTAGWCVRYGNMLGISGSKHATDLLGRPVRLIIFPPQAKTYHENRVPGLSKRNGCEHGGVFSLSTGKDIFISRSKFCSSHAGLFHLVANHMSSIPKSPRVTILCLSMILHG